MLGLLALTGVGGKKVLLGQLGLVLFSSAAAYLFVEHGTYVMKDIGHGCGGETHDNIRVIKAAWILLTLGVMCALKPLLWAFLPAAPTLMTKSIQRCSAVVIVGSYIFLTLVVFVRVVVTSTE